MKSILLFMIIKAMIFFVSRNILTKLDELVRTWKPIKTKVEKPESILLIRWDRIGDAVATLPLIHTIKKRYPTINIDVLCSEGNAWVFNGNSQIRRVIPLPGVGFSYGVVRMLKFIAAPFNTKVKKH